MRRRNGKGRRRHSGHEWSSGSSSSSWVDLPQLALDRPQISLTDVTGTGDDGLELLEHVDLAAGFAIRRIQDKGASLGSEGRV
jgi:hypothetical protein